jgi:hypothetical protein
MPDGRGRSPAVALPLRSGADEGDLASAAITWKPFGRGWGRIFGFGGTLGEAGGPLGKGGYGWPQRDRVGDAYHPPSTTGFSDRCLV